MAPPVKGAVNFNIDVNDLIHTLLAGQDKRNDIAVIVENGTTQELSVQWQVLHGNQAQMQNSTTIAPVDNGNGFFFALGIEAAGGGSQVFMYITTPTENWGFLAAALPLEENYTKGQAFSLDTSKETALSEIQKSNVTKNLSDNGPWTLSPNGTNLGVQVIMSNTSPAECYLQFEETGT